jgi:beta-lactamase regulating signal transducer with metallopeptidase domain
MHAVMNWIWQGCVVAVVLFMMVRLLDRARANVRYVVCWAGQLLVLALPLVAWLDSSPTPPARLPRVPVDAVVSVPDAWWASSLVMAAAWLVWVSVGAVRFGRAMLALRRARAQSRPFPAEVEERLAHWRQLRDRGRRPRLVVSESVTAAAVLGCGQPVIAVAPALATTLDAGELDRVLVHEWAHVRRRDDVVNLLQIAVRIVAGWHPAVWWIDRRLQAEREVACDETTVAITGAPKSYAACLVKLAELRGIGGSALAAPGVLTRSGLRARVTRILSRNVFLAPRRAVILAAAIAAVLVVVSVAVAQTRLVDQAAFAFPYESIQIAAVRFEGLAPVTLPTMTTRPVPVAPRRTERPVTQATVPAPVPEERVTEHAAPSQAEPLSSPTAPTVIELAEPQTPADAPMVVAPPRQSAAVEVESVKPPWASAADGGKALGRKSKEAGVATAGTFSRFARRVAGSF